MVNWTQVVSDNTLLVINGIFSGCLMLHIYIITINRRFEDVAIVVTCNVLYILTTALL